ncbi:hypothetical protein OIU76_029497 [Salix suchowensis]|nr:hypothetical protein OIU76_029497 [Salix suchowensis]
MAGLRFYNFSIFLVLFASLLVATSCHGLSRNALFIFGGSLNDVGNNNYMETAIKANFLPYGETFFKNATGRASDGRLVPDFIAGFARLPLIPPYLSPDNNDFTNGLNFASAGAGALTETNVGMTISLKTQLSFFTFMEKNLNAKLGEAKTKTLLSRAVYMFGIGSNDYITFATRNTTELPSYTREEYVRMVIGNLTDSIQEIHSMGGRKFGFSNVGDVGCSPFLRSLNNARNNGSGCMDEVTILAQLHNKALTKALKKLERKLEGFKFSIFDLYAASKERIDNPTKYGFKEGRVACCGTGPYKGNLSGCCAKTVCNNVSDYLFFDGVHPTEKANYQFARLMWSGGADIVKPYNLKTLLKKI